MSDKFKKLHGNIDSLNAADKLINENEEEVKQGKKVVMDNTMKNKQTNTSNVEDLGRKGGIDCCHYQT